MDCMVSVYNEGLSTKQESNNVDAIAAASTTPHSAVGNSTAQDFNQGYYSPEFPRGLHLFNSREFYYPPNPRIYPNMQMAFNIISHIMPKTFSI